MCFCARLVPLVVPATSFQCLLAVCRLATPRGAGRAHSSVQSTVGLLLRTACTVHTPCVSCCAGPVVCIYMYTGPVDVTRREPHQTRCRGRRRQPAGTFPETKRRLDRRAMEESVQVRRMKHTRDSIGRPGRDGSRALLWWPRGCWFYPVACMQTTAGAGLVTGRTEAPGARRWCARRRRQTVSRCLRETGRPERRKDAGARVAMPGRPGAHVLARDGKPFRRRGPDRWLRQVSLSSKELVGMRDACGLHGPARQDGLSRAALPTRSLLL